MSLHPIKDHCRKILGKPFFVFNVLYVALSCFKAKQLGNRTRLSLFIMSCCYLFCKLLFVLLFILEDEGKYNMLTCLRSVFE